MAVAMAEAVKADATGVADSGILLPLIFTLLAQVLVAVIRWRQQRPPAPAEPTKELSSRAVGVQVAALATSELDRQTAVALRALRSGLREAHILDLPPRYDDEEAYPQQPQPRVTVEHHAAEVLRLLPGRGDLVDKIGAMAGKLPLQRAHGAWLLEEEPHPGARCCLAPVSRLWGDALVASVALDALPTAQLVHTDELLLTAY